MNEAIKIKNNTMEKDLPLLFLKTIEKKKHYLLKNNI